ncbi:MAG: guanylate kinase [Syntrophomonadaceae bacterium]|nr:guanylate kinase [Syntrophomonadaceae bacterium]
MTHNGILFVISGPSGVGKGTLREALLKSTPNLIDSISVTTRPARIGERDGREYFFMDRDKFENLIKQEEFLEWAQVYSNLYGTPKQFVQENLDKGLDVLLEIDIQGAMQVKAKKPDGVFIFIAPPNVEELANRLINRGKDSQDSIVERLKACYDEMEFMREYDYLVINDNISEAIKNLEAIIIAERCKINKDKE